MHHDPISDRGTRPSAPTCWVSRRPESSHVGSGGVAPWRPLLASCRQSSPQIFNLAAPPIRLMTPIHQGCCRWGRESTSTSKGKQNICTTHQTPVSVLTLLLLRGRNYLRPEEALKAVSALFALHNAAHKLVCILVSWHGDSFLLSAHTAGMVLEHTTRIASWIWAPVIQFFFLAVNPNIYFN